MESLEWITDLARFAAVSAEWDALAGEQEMPFLLSSWLVPWWRGFGTARGLRVAVLWRDGGVGAGIPIWDGRRTWEAPVAEAMPPFCSMMATDDAARLRLAEQVIAAVPAETFLRALAADGPTLEALLGAAERRGLPTIAEEMPGTLLTETAGSLDDYRAGLSSKVRSEVGRLQRKAAREHDLEIAALEPPREVAQQWRGLLELEASGWKGESRTAILHKPEVRTFFDGLIDAFHATGALRLSELSLDGRLVATAMSLVHRGRVFTLKVAYDESHRRLGPGFVLLMAMIERCFELGLDAYEFSGTEEEYERRFATAERPRRRLRIYGAGPVGRARYVYRRSVRPRLGATRAAARRALRGMRERPSVTRPRSSPRSRA
ncbi:MAG: GNAT family N-acetyltransferase [Actinobacteria bacterium]|nr:GNAT family N-acetyltransferase [Actinomycetota bacterium]